MTQKKAKNYSVISFFCGCGGLDLGFRGNFSYHGENYKRQPFDIIAAYDSDAACVKTYNDYFGEHARVLDLKTASPNEMRRADVLIGGFPCQEFSSCGPLGGLESERGQLYKALIRYMAVHHPKVVVGENVINLERMQGGRVIDTIVTDLKSVGYKVIVWKMFAPDYGVPQRRTRLFFICVRDDIDGFPEKPMPNFVDAHRSIEWAIGDLINIADETVPNQSQFFAASRAQKGNGQGDESCRKDAPAYTIRANPKSRVQFHYELNRRLTVRECARIQTFPDDFIFSFPKTTSIRQIGNAVPPLLAYSVATAIKKFLESQDKESV